jgi:hypothetical protein
MVSGLAGNSKQNIMKTNKNSIKHHDGKLNMALLSMFQSFSTYCILCMKNYEFMIHNVVFSTSRI